MSEGVRIRAIMCDTCIFRPGNLMDLQSGRVAAMVKRAKAAEGCIPCHKYIDQYGGKRVVGPRATGAVCAGFAEHHATAPIQIARRLGMVDLVE